MNSCLIGYYLLAGRVPWFLWLVDPPYDWANRSTSHHKNITNEEKGGGDGTRIIKGQTQRQFLGGSGVLFI